MAWGTYLVLDALPQYLAVAGMLLLAITLFLLDTGRRANQIFALFLVVRGGSMLTFTLAGLAGLSPETTDQAILWSSVAPYFALAVPFVLVFFAAVYPRPRWWIGQTRTGALALLGAALALEGAYLIDHSLWAPFEITAEGLERTGEGVLFPLLGVGFLVAGVLAYVFARDHINLGDGPTGQALYFIALGFAITALYDGGLGLFAILFQGGFRPTLTIWIRTLAIVPAVAALAHLWWHARGQGPAERRVARRALLVAPLPVASAALPFLFPGADLLFLLSTGLWRLVFPALVAYALVRYEILGLDLGIKRTLKRGTVAGAFVLVFFVVSEGTEMLVASQWGTVFGLGAAGALTVALGPLQTMADRVADRAMPGVQDTQGYHDERRLEIYRATFEETAIDGGISQSEEVVLRRLRANLGLEDEVANRIEEDVLASLSDRGVTVSRG